MRHNLRARTARRPVARHSRQPTAPLSSRRFLVKFDIASTPHHTPMPVLTNRHSLQHHGPHAAYWLSDPPSHPLIPERMMPETLRDLALSLQIYKQGHLQLSQTAIPTGHLHIHALIIAQIALADGPLFPLRHQPLLAQKHLIPGLSCVWSRRK